MNRFIFIIIIMPVALGMRDVPDSKEKVIVDRLVYIYNLKSVINKSVWPGFTEKEFDLPLVYYTDTVCYIANPTDRFTATHNTRLLFNNGELRIYKTELLDSAPFHMETGMLFGDSSSAYNYKSPFMNCSSFEITQKMVHDVNSTEQWTTMILHEYFHGFQLKHQNFLNYFEKRLAISEDSLRKVYKAHPWFKESVDKENRWLLNALDANDSRSMNAAIDSLLTLRERRWERSRQKLGVDLSSTEQIYETMEGTARYVEYSLYSTFRKKRPDVQLLKSDKSYRSYEYFKDYNIEKDQWLYLTEKTGGYFYATGFNMVRLFEKLNVPYQQRVFKEGGVSLDQILKEYRRDRR